MKHVTITSLCFWEAIFLMTACAPQESPPPSPAPDWRATGVCYEIFVRSFFDSDGDGIGDLEGLTRKLDYVNDGDPDTRTDLGATCIWLMPVAESPSYHKYDVTDYYRIDPDYGTNEDFKRFTHAAHERGIRVLVDMVINHSSNRHPWFREALDNPESPYREWYRFSSAPGPDNEWGDNNWRETPAGDGYYYGFFSGRMPDLNWETEAVREEMKRVASFWLGEMGADGLRLDAVWHLMEGADGQAGHVARTHDMLREYGNYVRAAHPGSFTVGEVFDASDAIFAYYPDQLDAFFAFGVSDAILTAVRAGDAAGLAEAVLRMQERVPNDRYAPFLRNHDQSRTATVLEGDVERAKLAASLLLTLPGVPFVYYGEELGMEADKPDPRIRTPMPWDLAPNAGFTTGTPWEPLQADSLTANVAAQDGDPGSILSVYRELIHLRAEHPVLGSRAEFVPLVASSQRVVAYLRRGGDGSGGGAHGREEGAALVLANLEIEPLAGVTLSTAASGGQATAALPPGRYRLEALLGEETAAWLEVGETGRITDFTPVSTLEPLQAYVFAVVPAD